MKRFFIFTLIIFILSGCAGADKYKKDENFDPNRGGQTLVDKYEQFYLINMTDGLFLTREDFSEAEQITCEYCYFPYVKDKYVYYVGSDEANDDMVKKVDITTGNTTWLYSGIGITYFAPLGDGWIIVDEDKLIKLREDGMKLYEKDMEEIGFAIYSNDKFMIYSKFMEPDVLMLYDFEKNEATELFRAKGTLGETIICDGETVYYTIYHGEYSYNLCKLNLNTKEHEIIIENDFSGEFVISSDMCYYYHCTEERENYLKAINLETKEATILKELGGFEAHDINILDNKLFYRVSGYGKQLEVMDLTDNSSIYLYEKYAEITQRA